MWGRSNTANYWSPTSTESTCLRQLDRPGSWEWLKSAKPENTERIGWWQIRRIFVFNLVLFGAVIAALLAIMAAGSGYTASDFKEDAMAGLMSTGAISTSMAVYVTALYQRAWNRRAQWLGSDSK